MQVPSALRHLGHDVRHLEDVFGSDADGQKTHDDVWIERCVEEGWIVLSKDRESLLGLHRPTIDRLGAKVFILTRADLSGREQVERIVDNQHRIALKASKPGPMIWLVRRDRLDRPG